MGLPDAENREKILRAILAKEDLENDFDFKELALLTDGYTGSDLKVKNVLLGVDVVAISDVTKHEDVVLPVQNRLLRTVAQASVHGFLCRTCAWLPPTDLCGNS